MSVSDDTLDTLRDELNAGGGSGNGMSNMGFFWFMFIFHYLDVFFFMNMAAFRFFLYVMIALVVLPYVVFPGNKSNCRIYWILMTITFLLPYPSVIPFIENFPTFFNLLLTFTGMILIWFPPIPLYMLFSGYLGEVGNKFIIALVIFWIICAFAGIGPMQNSTYFKNSFLSKIPTVNIWGGITSLPEKFREGISNIVDSTKKVDIGAWYNKQMRIAAGDYYVGKVDENQQEKIGVFLEDVDPSEREYSQTDPVKIWATVTAKTLDDESIYVYPSCYNNDTFGSMDPVQIKVDSMEKHDVLCEFPPGSFPNKGKQKASMFAKFNFTTLAYIKNYFIDQEREKALQRDNKDPFTEYKITEKKPQATYTNGPVSIGMKINSPLKGLDRTEENTFRLGVTISNKWYGKVININGFVLQLPDTMSIVPNSCDKAILLGDSSITPLSKSFSATGYVTYHMDPADLAAISSFDISETINCKVKVDDIDGTLGASPVSTKYFRTLVRYSYELEEVVSINMNEALNNTNSTP